MNSPSLAPNLSAWTASARPRAGTAGARLLLPALLLFAAVWLLHLDHTSLTPPVDNIEQLTWVRSLELGYYKHPPLPTWLLWLPVRLLGASAWTSYLAGAACTLVSMVLLWRLLARLRGEHHATLAVLAVLCITFYNGRLHYYNHNVVLLPCVVAGAALCWQAHASGRLRWWAALGICLGLGALAKYQIVLAAASTLAFWLHQRGWRSRAHRRGLALATLLALLVAAPHLCWLPVHDFGPIRYAMDSSLGAGQPALHCLAGAAHWLLDQLGNRALPAWLLLAVALRAARRRGEAAVAERVPVDAAPASSRALLLCWGVLPLLVITVLGVATGARLQLHWGTAFLPLAVPAAMELGPLRRRWRDVPLASVWKAFAVLQLALLLLSQATSPRGPAALQQHHWRNFDSALLARTLAPAARELLGGGIRLVSGPAALAGALSLRLEEHPAVLIDGRADISPWVAPGLAERCGVLELAADPSRPGFRPVGAAFPGVSWRVVPPAAAAAPCHP